MATIVSSGSELRFMRKVKLLGTCIALLLSSSALLAQAEEEFQEFAEMLFTSLTDTTLEKPVEFVRILTLHDLIEDQPLSEKEKKIRHQQAEEEYSANYEIFHKRHELLKKQFMREFLSGTSYKMLDFKYEPTMENIYTGEITYLYEMSSMQALATMRFRFFYNGKGFGLMGPVEVEY